MDELDRLLDEAKRNLVSKSNGKEDAISTIDCIPKIIQSTKFTEEGKEPLKKAVLKTISKPAARGKSKDPETAGPNWFDFPRKEMTPELKRDLQLLQMRHVLDPKRFYKKSLVENSKFVAIGTIKEDASEFYSSRLARKQRKRTLAEEILATNAQTFTEKYKKIQAAKQSGRKKHMNNKKYMRS